MANVLKALDTSNAWSSDDSDEEVHFREMVQLSIQARRLESGGDGDELTATPTSRGIWRGPGDNSDEEDEEDDRVGDDGDDHGSPVIDRDDGSRFESQLERATFIPKSKSQKSSKHFSLTEVLANMSSGTSIEPAAPDLVAALKELGIDVDDVGGGRGARRKKSLFGKKTGTRKNNVAFDDGYSTFASSKPFTLPVRTGGGYDVRVPLPTQGRSVKPSFFKLKTNSKAPAARFANPSKYFESQTKKSTNGAQPKRLAVKHQEVLALGELTEQEHYGPWSHFWWSDHDEDEIGNCMSTSHATPIAFPIGFTTRTTLVVDGWKENHSRNDTKVNRWDGGRVVGGEGLSTSTQRPSVRGGPFGGRVTTNGDASCDDSPSFGGVECSVLEHRVGRPWEGPEFRVRWISCIQLRSTASGSRVTHVTGVGPTPAAAVVLLLKHLDKQNKYRPDKKVVLPSADVLFGFSTAHVSEALQERAACSDCAVVRLRAPQGLGMAIAKVNTSEGKKMTPQNNSAFKKLKKGTPQWMSRSGSFPLLVGYRVTFSLCLGRSACCEVISSDVTESGIAFSVTIREDGKVVNKAVASSPDLVWSKLKAERQVVVTSGLLDQRLHIDGREKFLGGYLFGLESESARRMVTQTQTAMDVGDSYLLAEPFLRDLYFGDKIIKEINPDSNESEYL